MFVKKKNEFLQEKLQDLRKCHLPNIASLVISEFNCPSIKWEMLNEIDIFEKQMLFGAL